MVDCGMVDLYVQGSKQSFKEFDRTILNEMESAFGIEIVNECRRISHCRYDRVKRCREKIGDLVAEKKAVFLTLTFNDRCLSRSTTETRRRKVLRALKRSCSCYVAHIDFGDKEKNPESKEREHYHAIVDLTNEKALRDYWEKNCGFLSVKPVGCYVKDLRKLTLYINKLNAHCFKNSTRMHSVIYSRRRQKKNLG